MAEKLSRSCHRAHENNSLLGHQVIDGLARNHRAGVLRIQRLLKGSFAAAAAPTGEIAAVAVFVGAAAAAMVSFYHEI